MPNKIRIQYVTTDGEVFDSSELADRHQATLLTTEQQEKVRRVERAMDTYIAANKNATTRQVIHWLAKNWASL